MDDKKIDWKKLTKRRISGLGLMAGGGIVLFSPILIGEWTLALLGGVFLVVGAAFFVQALGQAETYSTVVSYVTGLVSVLLGILLFLSPRTVLSGLFLGITLFLLIDGGVKIYAAAKKSGRDRRWGIFNGSFVVVLAILVRIIFSAELGLVAVGIVLGTWLIVQGWTLFFTPEQGLIPADEVRNPRTHPDRYLGLEPGDDLQKVNEEILANDRSVTRQDIYWSTTVLGILFASHFVRAPLKWSVFGIISPFVAVAGDAAAALLLGIVLILPFRLLWRKLTRPFERAAWRRLRSLPEELEEPSIAERLINYWLESRMRFSHELRAVRLSLNYAFWRMLRFGLPITAVFVAISSIWGFSWYFNSENWASGVFQIITQGRVDTWRKRGAEEVEKALLERGADAKDIFSVRPEGITDSDDFSFVVIGDTGEGDASQTVLRDQIIKAGNRDDVRFLVLSSDVIYPDGKMDDYEDNFYLPFKGFSKPIYAIPGNHDWYDADVGFNANFLEPEAAIIALKAGFGRDLGMESKTMERHYGEIVAEGKRLREYYGIKNGLQRAPFFDLHKDGFSLIAVDTGILRKIDSKEREWLEASLKRAGDNFKFVILGHPFYVAGRSTFEDDADFSAIYQLLRRFQVDLVMAGDTHDFEYYNEQFSSNGQMLEMRHFVNGGGGAYLSIGTAAGFPEDPFTKDFVFYPRTDQLIEKINKEAPFWKKPLLLWMQTLQGWPFDQEVLSGAFDFNNAPFFQSFVVVNVERSKGQIRIQLVGAKGPLEWKDVQTGPVARPKGTAENDKVEFLVPLVKSSKTVMSAEPGIGTESQNAKASQNDGSK